MEPEESTDTAVLIETARLLLAPSEVLGDSPHVMRLRAQLLEETAGRMPERTLATGACGYAATRHQWAVTVLRVSC